MVAVVGGAGLGLSNTSRELAGTAAGLGEAALGRGPERVTLNAATGNLVVQSRDEFLVAAGADIELLRTYNSLGGWDGDNGDGWRLGIYRRVSGLAGALNAAGSTVRRIEADGHEAVYAWDGSRYVGRDGAGAHDTLVFDTTTRAWTWTDGDTAGKESYVESAPGSGVYRLVQATDPEGHATRIAYDAAGLVLRVESWKAGAGAADESVALQYEAGSRRLVQVTTHYRDAAGAALSRVRVRYEYDAAGRLAAVHTDLSPEDRQAADGRIYTVRYGYDTAGRVASVVQGDGSALAVEYDDAGRVRRLTDALGRVTTLSYDSVARRTTVTDALGQATVLAFDAADRLVEISGAAIGGASLRQAFAYDADGDLVASRNAAGEETVFEHTASGALSRRTDAAGEVLERRYDAANRPLSETRYAAPDPDGVAGPALPAVPLHTRYLYDTSGGKGRLRFVVDPDGSVTESVYDALGRVATRTRHAAASYPVGGAEPTLAALEVWAAARTTAQRAAAERSEYGYDLRGQQVSLRTYASNTVSGDSVVYGAAAEQRWVYDASGRLLQSIDALGRSTVMAYDGLDRLIARTDATGATTLWTYDDAGSRVALRFAHGLEQVSRYDRAGRLVASIETQGSTVLGETRYVHDALDRVVMIEDPTGLRRWTLHDAAGRPSAEIGARGRFVEHLYDAAGRRVQTVDHAVLLGAATLAGLVDAGGQPVARSAAELRPPADAARDRVTTRWYDRAGRLVALQDADGAITETQYDGASRAVATVAYATVAAIARLDTGSATVVNPPPYIRPAADPARDRVTRSFYSDAGLLRATLDAEGYLVERRYDAAGRLTEQIAYATATPAGARASGTLAQLLPAASAADRRSLWFHDGQGRPVGTLDADGFLTETVYDAQGHRVRSIRYATPLSGPVATGAALAAVRPVPVAADRSTHWQVDALGRVLRETAPDGTVTRHDYDAGGRLVSTVRAEGSAEARIETRRFDLQGRVIAELSAEGAALLVAGQTAAQVEAIWAAHGSSLRYDAAGRRVERREADGSVTVYYHDAAGREVCSILKTALGGEVRQTAYNAFGEVEAETLHADRIAAADLAALTGGRLDAALAARLAALADASRDLRATTLRTRRGQVAQAIDALGGRTDHQYTAFGQLATTLQDRVAGQRLRTDSAYDRRGLLVVTTADPLGLAQETRSGYDAFARVTSTVDARGQRSTLQYARASAPAGGRAVIVDGPAGTRTTVYDAFGGVVQEIDALGHHVRYVHDAAARRLTMTTAGGVVTVTESTRHGQVARITDARGVTTFAYDRDGRLLSTTDAAGGVTQNRYDAAGNLVLVVAGLKANGTAAPLDTGATTSTEYVYDAARRVLIRRVDPAGLRLETRYEYDGRGRAVRSTDPAGVVTTSGFDAAGRLRERVVDAAPGGLQLRTAYSYDAQGRTLTVTEGAGTAAARTTETRYDALGRRIAETVDPAGLAITRTWEYDAAGLLVLERDALGHPTRHVHDAAGRLALMVDATGAVTRRLYDAGGRLVGIKAHAQRLGGGTVPDLAPAALSDAQIEAAVAALAGPADAWTQYVLDDDGRIVYTVDAGGAVTQNRHDGAGRVVETVRYASLRPGPWSSGSSPVADAARDQSTLTVHDGAGRVRYVVDPLDFVTETVYDTQGRAIATKRYAQSIARPATATEASVAAALSGRLDAANDRSDFHAYDAAGRLRYAVDAEGYVTERRYDALGRVTDTLRSLQPGKFGAPPTLSQAEAVFRTTRSFTGGATGVVGTAHVYESNRIRLVSRPDAAGGYATTRSSAAPLELGGSVAFDLTPLGLQPELVAALESPGGVPLTRFGLVLGADGRIDAQTIDRATGVEKRVDVGAYAAGTTYRVEIATSEGGAVLYVYERGRARDSGIVYRSDEPLSWNAAAVAFHANRDAVLTGESSAVVDDLAECRAALLSEDRYDAAGRLAASIDGEGVITRYASDAAGRLIESVAAAGLPEASTSRRLYDAAGRLLEETVAHGSPAAATTRHEVDAEGRVVARVDPRGIALARSDTAWAQGERAALGYPTALAALSAAQKQALAERYTTRYAYDAAGHRTRISEPLGRVTTLAYDAFGRAATRTEPGASGPRTSYTFHDGLGRVVQEVDAERYLTSHAYDAFGNRIETLRHDRRVAGTIMPASAGGAAVAVLAADPGDGRAHVVASPAADASTRRSFDRRNQRLTERDAEGHVEGSLEALDAFGQRRSVTNRLGGRALYAYDRLGRLVRETLPVEAPRADGSLIDVVHQYAYDSRGNRVLAIEAVGLLEQRTTRWRYDHEDRQVRRTGMAYVADDGSSVTPADRWRYDALGRLVEQLSDGRVVGQAVLGGRRSLAWYDARGQRIAEVSADAVLAQFTYDPAGQQVVHRIAATRLAALPGRPGGSVPVVAASADDRKLGHVYDALGRRTETWLDGVWHWEFGQPVTLPGAERIALERLAYDAAGNVVQRPMDADTRASPTSTPSAAACCRSTPKAA